MPRSLGATNSGKFRMSLWAKEEIDIVGGFSVFGHRHLSEVHLFADMGSSHNKLMEGSHHGDWCYG